MVYYLGAYSGDGEKLKRKNIRTNPGGTGKMDYLLYALYKEKIPAVLVEIAPGKDTGFCREEWISKDSLQSRVCLSSLVVRVFGKNIVRGDLTAFFLKRFFRRHITKEDTVIVYHSLSYCEAIRQLHSEIGFRLILEVEEIYHEVVSCTERVIKEELTAIQDADAYIFSTEGLNRRLNGGEKPYLVVNGNYLAQPRYGEPFEDGRCHCVYAGTLEATKGAALAAETALYLDENYAVHILGYGTEKEIQKIRELVESIQTKTRCAVTYDGVMQGEEYLRFLQKCRIGFCTQMPETKYIETSFPSKILVYLANGLRVVCGKYPAVENSKIGSRLDYYEQQSPQSVAETVRLAAGCERDSRAILMDLDEKFRSELSDFLGSKT